MIHFEFKDGISGSVHDGEWNIADEGTLDLVKAIADDLPLKDFYHLDSDLYLVEEVLKIIPGKITGNDRPHKPVKGRIY